MNIPDEIDVPGESYIDRENMIMYFYPTEDFSYDNMYITTSGNILSFRDTKNVTFDGIDIKYTRDTSLKANNIENITIKNCEIAHVRKDAMILKGENITISRCDIYDFVGEGVSISGGDRTNLISGESKIENCRLHDVGRTMRNGCQAIRAKSTGPEILHFEIYNTYHQSVHIENANDAKFMYNDMHDCAISAGDMGALYFGRNPSMLGIEIKYNYFHDIGNECRMIQTDQQMIYMDGGTMRAEIYGNVFENTICYALYGSNAITGNGAQFADVRNNIFIDAFGAFDGGEWCVEGSDNKEIQDKWFLDLYNRSDTGHGITNLLYAVNFDSKIWHEHYKGTIWENLYNYVDSERIAEYANLSDEELAAIAHENAPSRTNIVKDNVMVNVQNILNTVNAICENNYVADTDIFVSYDNGQFSLTSEGLKKICEIISNLENVPFGETDIID